MGIFQSQKWDLLLTEMGICQSRKQDLLLTLTVREMGIVADAVREMGIVADAVREMGIVADAVREMGIVADAVREMGIVADGSVDLLCVRFAGYEPVLSEEGRLTIPNFRRTMPRFYSCFADNGLGGRAMAALEVEVQCEYTGIGGTGAVWVHRY